MTFLDLLIYALATFRLSLFVSQESGPAHLMRKLRRLPPPKSSAREGLSCPWCLSWWFGAIVVALVYYVGGTIVLHSIYALALSGAAICIHQQWTKS